MKPLQSLANNFKVRRQIHHTEVSNPELGGEVEDELVEQIALPIPRWNCREMIIDLTIITCWLNCIFKPTSCKEKENILYLRSL